MGGKTPSTKGKKEKARSSAEKSVKGKGGAKEKLARLKADTKMADLQETVKTTLTKEEREKLRQKSQMQNFLSGLLGLKKTSAASQFLAHVGTWLASKLGAKGSASTLTDEEVYGKIDKEKARVIEAGFIAHQGSSEKPNSKEGIAEALRKGEGEIEFDVRLINGQLYLRHDALEKGDKKVESLTRFSEVLALFQQYPKAKMFIDVKGGRKTAMSIIAAIRSVDQKQSLEKRATFQSFNPEALKAVRDNMKGASLFFAYVPTGGFPMVGDLFKKAAETKSFSKNQLVRVLRTADALNGNASNYASSVEHSSLHVNGVNVYKEKMEEQIHTYKSLPPDNILKMIKGRDGALVVPWGLVKNFTRFFQEAKAAGVKVAVYGFRKTGTHDAETKKAIALGANFIITDHANVIALK